MMKLENKLELCPYANRCAVEYGDDLACQDGNSYEDCVLYKRLEKQEKKLR